MSFLDYLVTNWDHVLRLTLAHAVVVLIAVGVTTLIGVAVGILVYRRERAANVAMAITSTFLTIPSFALFALALPIFGLGATSTIIVLIIYGLLPVMRNTVTGLQAVDPAISESAEGMGMSARQRLLRIDLPLAWPVIITGVRVSTMLLLGIAAIGAAISGPGLGNDIFAGLARLGGANALNLVLGGILGIVVLALIFDAFFTLFSKLTTSRGIQ
ncbi:MAG: ABC transporter permease [Luteimonas sp.]|nr:ABC transporter permease [Luteimonas sp.]